MKQAKEKAPRTAATMQSATQENKLHNQSTADQAVCQEEKILIGRSPEFYQIAKQLSEHIAELPLSVPNNDKLVGLMIQQVTEAERAAFNQGLRMGVKFSDWEANRPATLPKLLRSPHSLIRLYRFRPYRRG